MILLLRTTKEKHFIEFMLIVVKREFGVTAFLPMSVKKLSSLSRMQMEMLLRLLREKEEGLFRIS